MPTAISVKPKRIKPRYSFTTVALVGLTIFTILLIFMAESFNRRQQQELVDQNLRLRLGAMAMIVEEQLLADDMDNTLRHRLVEAYSRAPGIIWTQVIPSPQIAQHSDHPALHLPSNSAITRAVLSELVEEVGEMQGSQFSIREFGHETLIACLLADGHVFFVLFDRNVVAAQFSKNHLSLWLIITGFVLSAGVIQFFSSRLLLQQPVVRLSQALDRAETDLEFHLDKPLPNNEIGWLGERIGEWLTRLRKTQNELERMALVAQSTRNAVMILDANSRTTWVNQAFSQMTGYTAEDVLGRNPKDYMRGPETEPETIIKVEGAIASGQGYLVEGKLHRKDGSIYWAAGEGQPVRDEDGAINGWVCVYRDISEQKLAEMELAQRIVDLEAARERQTELTSELQAAKKSAERSNASKSEFLANMSHEIRTPMNGVLGMADVLLTTNLSTDQREFVETIKQSGASLLTILNDILDLSKLEIGAVTLEKVSVPIDQLLNSVCELMSPRATSKGVALNYEISSEVPPEIIEDGGRLRQILLNLVGNATKFTNSGRIDIRARLASGHGKARYLRFEIVDTGIGISEENQRKLFARFEQGDAAAARAAGGTGLGLSICRELTLLMGGEIGLKSKQDKGSTFWIEIPFLAARTNQPGKTSPKNGAGEAAQSLRSEVQLNLLLAEDHAVNQSLMKAFIGKMGHKLTIASDGVEAVKAVRDGGFDMILMDIQMPRMDGVMATKVIRSLETGPNDIPIIAVTANAMAGQRDHYMESGMNGYVSKPVQLNELRMEIERVWAEHNYEDRAASGTS